MGVFWWLVQFLLFFTCYVGDVSAFSSPGGEQERKDMVQPLTLSIMFSKQTVKTDESIEITCLISNSGKERLTIRTVFVHKLDRIKVSDITGKEMKGFFRTFPSASFGPETFLELDSGGKKAMTYKVSLKKGPVSVVDNDGSEKVIQGFFLDLGDSAIQLSNDNKFILKCQYDQFESDREDGKKHFGIQNVWVGKITSGPIELRIEK